MMYSVWRYVALALAKALLRVQAVGQEHIPPSGGVIIAANHVSYLDPPILGCTVPRRASFMAKAELFGNRITKLIFHTMNAFPVRRKQLDRRAIEEAVRRVSRGEALIMFPEGTISADGELLPPRYGVGMIAAKTGAPVVPAFISGSEKALPPDSSRFRPSRVTVYFGAPMDFSGYGNGRRGRELYARISAEIMGEIGKLRPANEGARQELFSPAADVPMNRSISCVHKRRE